MSRELCRLRGKHSYGAHPSPRKKGKLVRCSVCGHEITSSTYRHHYVRDIFQTGQVGQIWGVNFPGWSFGSDKI